VVVVVVVVNGGELERASHLKADVAVLVVHVQVGRVKAQPQSRRRRRQRVSSRPRTGETHVSLLIGDVLRAEHQSGRDLVLLLRVNTAPAHTTPSYIGVM